MADISTFDNFFDKSPPESGFQTKRRKILAQSHNMTLKKAPRHIKNFRDYVKSQARI